MELKDLLKIERIPNYAFNENGLLRLNMSIKEIYDILQPALFTFFDELGKHGFIIDTPILASVADIRDYRELHTKDDDSESEYTDYEHERG